MKYMANMLREPQRKPHFAIVLTGESAVTISHTCIMCKVAGSENWTMGEASLLFGRFNGHMRGKLLVVLRGLTTDETVSSVKDIVTSPSIVIEERYHNAVRIPSHHRVVVVSPTEFW